MSRQTSFKRFKSRQSRTSLFRHTLLRDSLYIHSKNLYSFYAKLVIKGCWVEFCMSLRTLFGPVIANELQSERTIAEINRSCEFLAFTVNQYEWGIEPFSTGNKISKVIDGVELSMQPNLIYNKIVQQVTGDFLLIENQDNSAINDEIPKWQETSFLSVPIEINGFPLNIKIRTNKVPIFDIVSTIVLLFSGQGINGLQEFLPKDITLAIEEKKHTEVGVNIAVIGAGGIGSNLVELLIPTCSRLNLEFTLSLIDGDIVEVGNLGHQRYQESDIGCSKVDALTIRLGEEATGIDINPISENLRTFDQLNSYDLIVICVDRPEPRRLVHNSGKPWIDLRCTGDGWMVLSSDSNPSLVEKMTPDHEPKSCQIEGALENGNLEFGFAVAAAYGAQWVIQTLRNQPAPVQAMGSLTYGSFKFPAMEVSA